MTTRIRSPLAPPSHAVVDIDPSAAPGEARAVDAAPELRRSAFDAVAQGSGAAKILQQLSLADAGELDGVTFERCRAACAHEGAEAELAAAVLYAQVQALKLQQPAAPTSCAPVAKAGVLPPRKDPLPALAIKAWAGEFNEPSP